ncbi:MAG TPA: hypothetical protein VE669_04065, partial [Actinomycetota bacterium]|nr:hypothetical protein [Actinomycetota bacterium]
IPQPLAHGVSEPVANRVPHDHPDPKLATPAEREPVRRRRAGVLRAPLTCASVGRPPQASTVGVRRLR